MPLARDPSILPCWCTTTGRNALSITARVPMPGAAQEDIGQSFASTRRKSSSLTRGSFHGVCHPPGRMQQPVKHGSPCSASGGRAVSQALAYETRGRQSERRALLRSGRPVAVTHVGGHWDLPPLRRRGCSDTAKTITQRGRAQGRSARDPLDLDGKSTTGWLPEPAPRIGCFCTGDVLSWLWQASLVSQFADADSPEPRRGAATRLAAIRLSGRSAARVRCRIGPTRWRRESHARRVLGGRRR